MHMYLATSNCMNRPSCISASTMGSLAKQRRLSSSAKEVNLDLARKKVWLVKVPKFVAEAWEASEDGAEVARLTAPPSGGGQKGWKLTLDPSTSTSGLSTFVIKERKSCQDVAVFSTTSSSVASDPNDGLHCPPLLAVEGRVTSVADCMPDASSVGSSYFRLKERALTRPKRDARKTIQLTGAPPPTFK